MQPHPKRDYYEVLGVERTCTAQELKSSFRKLALQFHPDKNAGDKKAEEKFKELSEAYEVLSDPEKRARYDRFGHQVPGGFGPSPFDQGFGGANINDIFEGIFGDIFGGGGRRAAPGVIAHAVEGLEAEVQRHQGDVGAVDGVVVTGRREVRRERLL